MTAQPIRDVDQLVGTYLDLADKIAQLTDQQNNLKAQLRDLGIGDHPSSHGVTVKISPPARRFNVDRAWTMLTPEQQIVCVSPDAKKIKGQLPPALTDACMDEGTGEPIVRIG